MISNVSNNNTFTFVSTGRLSPVLFKNIGLNVREN